MTHRLESPRAPRSASTVAARLVDLVGGVSIGLVLAALAALRRAKAVHPQGESYVAALSVAGASRTPADAGLLSMPGTHRAIVRFSRSLGLPRPLPDLLGMSIRVVDAYGPERHQDFLLVSSVDLPVLHHVFVPARDVQQRPYSSSLPYRAGGRPFVVGAVPDPRSPRLAGGTELERLRAAAATGELRFGLAVAPIGGRFVRVAELRIGLPLDRAADALRFNPWNTGNGLRPVGALNGMRRYAYPMSQWAWRHAQRGGAARQDEAEHAVQAAVSAAHEPASDAAQREPAARPST